jgi:proline dehydrogenase
MLRSFFIALSKLKFAQRWIMKWPFAWRAARRFIAGEKPEDAIQVVQELNSKGMQASLDHLGENTLNPEDADQATKDVLLLLDVISKANVVANVSVKLTQIGLALGAETCQANLVRILTSAREKGNFIRLDMEDSQTTEQILATYTQMRRMGFDNLGVVIQSYLFRSEKDVRQIGELGGKVRLCKGAYKEPAQIAYPKKADVDANFDCLADLLMDQALEQNKITPANNLFEAFLPPIPALATHDEVRIQHAIQYAKNIGLDRTAFEFQMLYGIRRDLQEQLTKQGYRVRVYVPYGTHWYPYFMRRLAERPANVWFFLSNYFKK